MSKYSRDELKDMARTTLAALHNGDRRGLLVILGISARTNGTMPPDEIVARIEALALGDVQA